MTAGTVGWRIPEPTSSTDRTHAARVKLLRAGLAQRILEIPADCSKRSRAVRIGKAKEKVSAFYAWICKRHTFGAGATVTVTDDRLISAWIQAYVEAVNAVTDALAAGEPLEQFLFAP
jgi:hypothetical protein